MSLVIKDKEFIKQLENFSKKHTKQQFDVLARATLKMDKYAKFKAPTDEGKLKQGIEMSISRNTFTGEVESTASYSEAVEKGTRPHDITIKNKKVLAGKAVPGNKNKGGWSIWGTKVKHPGTKPRPFLEPAFIVAKNFFMNEIKKTFN